MYLHIFWYLCICIFLNLCICIFLILVYLHIFWYLCISIFFDTCVSAYFWYLCICIFLILVYLHFFWYLCICHISDALYLDVFDTFVSFILDSSVSISWMLLYLHLRHFKYYVYMYVSSILLYLHLKYLILYPYFLMLLYLLYLNLKYLCIYRIPWIISICSLCRYFCIYILTNLYLYLLLYILDTLHIHLKFFSICISIADTSFSFLHFYKESPVFKIEFTHNFSTFQEIWYSKNKQKYHLRQTLAYLDFICHNNSKWLSVLDTRYLVSGILFQMSISICI